MSEKIIVPALGESVTEATVSKWLKNEGDKVNSDEPIVELETDKVNVEVPAPINGILEKISIKEGQTVSVGTLLGSIGANVSEKNGVVKEVKSYSPPAKKEQIPIKKAEEIKEDKIVELAVKESQRRRAVSLKRHISERKYFSFSCCKKNSSRIENKFKRSPGIW